MCVDVRSACYVKWLDFCSVGGGLVSLHWNIASLKGGEM